MTAALPISSSLTVRWDSDGGLQHHAVAELQPIGEDPLLDLTDCGDIVVDPFLGSGSTSRSSLAIPAVGGLV
jgi:hypothetical protein